MSGFVGYFSYYPDIDIDLVREAKGTLQHDSDMQNIIRGKYHKIAFNDLSMHNITGKEVQTPEFGDVVVYMNGKIYNNIELQEKYKDEYTLKSGSDVEIIHFLYRKYGLDFLDKINGIFALVIIDRKRGVSYLIRDRYGEKPLYYHTRKQNLFFASEVKALKEILDLDVDKTNIAMNFLCWHLPSPFSLYKDTLNVNPGCFIEYRNGIIKEKRWYKPKIDINVQEYVGIEKNFLDLFEKSMELRIRDTGEIGVFLSGGLDSNIIAYFLREINKKDFIAFGADIPNKELHENTNTDVYIPNKICTEFNINYMKDTIDYHYFNDNILSLVSNYDGIFMDSGGLVFYALSKMAKKNSVSVILTGLGGDELFGGYPWQRVVKLMPRCLIELTNFSINIPYIPSLARGLHKVSSKAYKLYQLLVGLEVLQAGILGSPFKKHMLDTLVEVEKILLESGVKAFNFARESIKSDFYNQFQFASLFNLMTGQNFMADSSSTCFSIESRSPFLDYNLLEYMMSIPDKTKAKKGNKSLLRKIMKDKLPNYVTEAGKSGPTMPIMDWFKEDEKKSVINKFIQANIGVIHDFVSESLGNKLKDDVSIMYEGQALQAFALISFILWAKLNIENSIHDTSLTFEDIVQL